MLKRKNILIIFIICVFSFNYLISGRALGQEESKRKAISFKTMDEIEQERIIQKAKDNLDRFKEMEAINKLYSYKAVAEKSPSLCDTLTDPDDCWDKVDDLLKELYLYGVGKCNTLEDKEDKQFCEALRKSDCLGLSGSKRLFCEGFLNLDFQLCEKALKQEIIEGKVVSKDYEEELKDARRELAYYTVFKTNRALNCIQLLGDDAYIYKTGCYILASDFPQKTIDRYTLDFAYYYYSEKESNKGICDMIEDSYIKQHCKKGTEFSIFVQGYFLELD